MRLLVPALVLLASGCSYAAAVSGGAALSEDAADEALGAAAVNAHFEAGWSDVLVTEVITVGAGPDVRMRAWDRWFHLTLGGSLNLALELDQVGFYGRLGVALVSYDDLDGAVWGGAFGPYLDLQVGFPLLRQEETWLEPGRVLRARRTDRGTLILTVGVGIEYLHRFETDGAGALTATVGLRWSHQRL